MCESIYDRVNDSSTATPMANYKHIYYGPNDDAVVVVDGIYSSLLVCDCMDRCWQSVSARFVCGAANARVRQNEFRDRVLRRLHASRSAFMAFVSFHSWPVSVSSDISVCRANAMDTSSRATEHRHQQCAALHNVYPNDKRVI